MSHDTLYLGVDPGLNRTGYAVLRRTPRGPQLVEGGVIRTNPREGLAARVHEIGRGLREVIEDHGPKLLAIEQVFSHVRNPKTAILMAHARGAILLTAVAAGLTVVHYTPAQIKRLLTGSGRASKEQIQRAIATELKLKEILSPNDVADATAVALCLYHGVRYAA